MWKFVTRGIRETLERRACRTNVYSQTNQDSGTNNTGTEVKQSLTCRHKFLAPSVFSFNKGSCGSTRCGGGTRDNEHGYKWNAKHTWFEAAGWSSVLAVGWVVCQTLCLRRRFFENEQPDNPRNKLTHFSEKRLSHLLGHVLNLEPRIFPVVHCAGTEGQQAREEAETEWVSDKPYGPLTVEEALKEATEEFESVHKLVMGEIELHSGIRALEEKRYTDAVQHFTAGADLSSPASMFNLGLCYELGVGTLADQTKAAKWYNDAAEQGHADAMYNLGVFYAQGRGGVSIDLGRARNYFSRAAELGQTQARNALELEKQRKAKRKGNTKIVQDGEVKVVYRAEREKVRNQMSGLSYHDTENAIGDVAKTKTPTEIFLGYLGLHEPTSLMPVTVGPKDFCVPY